MGQPVGENQVRIFSILLSLLTSVLCVLSLNYGKGLYRVGSLWHSPIYLLCLAGEYARHRLYVRLLNPNAADMVITRDALTNRKRQPSKVREMVKSTVLIIGAVFIFCLLIVAQGAPVLDSHQETFTLAVLLTVLSVWPLVEFLGVQNALQVMGSNSDLGFINKLDAAYLEVCKVTAVGVLFGAWAGSIAYPLDWDRSWQAYPIPNVVGAIGGLAASSCYQLVGIFAATVRQRLNDSLGM